MSSLGVSSIIKCYTINFVLSNGGILACLVVLMN